MNTNFMSTCKARLQKYILPSLQWRGLGVGLLVAAAVLVLGVTSCSKADTPSPTIPKITEEDLVGLWWDEFEYSDVTEDGISFSRVLLVVMANADHTGCIYLGLYDGTSDEPLAVYGGPEDAGFLWQLLPDGTLQLSDPVTGEILTQSRADGSSYGDKMTDVSSTNMTCTPNGMKMTNGGYSGLLVKADAGKEADILKKLTKSSLTPNTNLGNEDDLGINDNPQGGWGR